ncbi:MAG: hypothetical protein EXQ47_02995 [Bryobacterales bacterium]|nr:hypothetical protein [Bryobacterales bacterium]
MPHPAIICKKYTILVHRWMGVFFCVLFAAWFASGIVMMYWDFPQVLPEDRWRKSPTLEASEIRISPAEAYRRLNTAEAPDRVSVYTLLDRRPVYRFAFRGNVEVVTADTGERIADVPRETGLRIAAAWTGQDPAGARVDLVRGLDQWTVQSNVRRQLPFWKTTFPDGEEVYVSRATGEVAQHTTRGSRIGAYCGAIPHWLYFSALRRHTFAWRSMVIWLSALGVLMNLFGLVVGVWMYSPAKKYRLRSGASSIPYDGQKHWHTLLGLVFGLFAFTWVLSGMFSMNPLAWSPGSAPDSPAKALRGPKWNSDAFPAASPAQALQQLPPEFKVKELRLTFAGGQPAYLAVEDLGRSRLIPAAATGELPSESIDPEKMRRLMAIASRPHAIVESRLVTAYEPYYIDRHHRKPLPALFVRLNDAEQSIYYIDLKTGQVVESYDARSRAERWLYHGLHSLDLPWLYRNRPAWDVTVLTLMLGGTALCVTSVVIGYRRARRKVRGLIRRQW